MIMGLMTVRNQILSSMNPSSAKIIQKILIFSSVCYFICSLEPTSLATSIELKKWNMANHRVADPEKMYYRWIRDTCKYSLLANHSVVSCVHAAGHWGRGLGVEIYFTYCIQQFAEKLKTILSDCTIFHRLSKPVCTCRRAAFEHAPIAPPN